MAGRRQANRARAARLEREREEAKDQMDEDPSSPRMDQDEDNEEAAEPQGDTKLPKYCFLTPSDYRGTQQTVKPTDIWTGLKETTTAHGIPHVTHAKGPIKKAFWGLMTAVTVGALIFNLTSITMSFFSFNIDVTIQLYHENELVFPAVTVCNMSPIRKSALGGGGLGDLKRRRKKRSASSSAAGDHDQTISRQKRSTGLCDSGWSEYDGYCYLKSATSATQTVAQSTCQSSSANLASITDAAENTFVQSISIGVDSSKDYWTGLERGATWIWLDGNSATYDNWIGSAPGGSGGTCSVMTAGGQWTDRFCINGTVYYVCKKAVPPAPTPGSCCCTCCFPSPYSGATASPDTCSSCSADSITNAAYCAAQPTTTTTTTASPPTTTTSKPQPIPGSSFPERVQTRVDFQKEEQLTQQLADLPVAEKAELGYSATDLILDCQYSGFTCNASEFATFYNPILGNCYIFNSGWDAATDNMLRSMKAGRRHGLHMVVNINQDEYVKDIGDTAGIRLVVHPQTRMPFPEDEGITVSPGHSTSIGLRQVLLNRQGQPYGNCTDSEADHSGVNVYEEHFPVHYSSTACQKTCYQGHVISRCNCGDPYFPLKGAAFNKATPVKACDSSNITQDDCKYLTSLLFNNNTLQCDCPDSCNDMAFSLEVSLGQWPSKVQKTEILTNLKEKIGTSFDINHPSDYKDNLIKVEVYYEEFNFEKIAERPAYEPGNYLSDIGGVLGLWIGFSILTIFEFIEFGLDLLVLSVIRCRNPKPSGMRSIQVKPAPVPTNAPMDHFDMGQDVGKRGMDDRHGDVAGGKAADETDMSTFAAAGLPPPPRYSAHARDKRPSPPPPYTTRGGLDGGDRTSTPGDILLSLG